MKTLRLLLPLRSLIVACSLSLLAVTQTVSAESLTLLSTTSTENSGLLGALLPEFAKDTGIEVKVLAMGTGQAMRAAQNGDGDLLLVHDKISERAFVKAGYGEQRIPMMYNDFILVGPKSDPAKVLGQKDISQALQAISKSHSIFISRGDNSGTHKAELRLWQAAGIDVQQASETYREAGAGMGRTLNVTASINAYTLVDRGTWMSFQNKQKLVIQVEGDKRLFNQYSVVLLNQEKYPHLHHQEAVAFADWLISDKGQEAIGDFTIGKEPLFFPNYHEQKQALSNAQ